MIKIKRLSHFFNPYIKVKKSGIHSKGVFAKKDIPKGTQIIEYIGKIITPEESEKIYEKMFANHLKNPNKASVYTFNIDENRDLNGGVWWNLAKYMNHCCSPNCESQMEDNGQIFVYAIRDIKKGEELVYNYGYDAEHYKDHLCRCNSKNCVGHIVAQDQWDKLKKLKEKEAKKLQIKKEKENKKIAKKSKKQKQETK